MTNTSGPNRLPDDWHVWVVENAQRGCSRDSILQGLAGGGFEPRLAERSVDEALARRVALPDAPPSWPAVAADPLRPEPSVDGNGVDLGATTVRVVATLERPRVIVFDRLLDAAECDAMIALADARMTVSTVVDDATGDALQHGHRSSSGAWFRRSETGLIAMLEQRIATLLAWPEAHGEGLQVMRYDIGGEYRAHFDHFDPDKAASLRHLAEGGQRVATLIMYLSDVAAGGATRFESAGFEVRPQRGAAVYFCNVDTAGRIDPATLHAGLPVISGVKYIATKWLRRHVRG